MSRGRALAEAIPPLAVGVSTAGAAEMSAGLLLYSAEGFLPALTLILTVETGAFAIGLWSGFGQRHEGKVEALRKRWLFALVTFAVAAACALGMTVRPHLFSGGFGQGLGLALLGSLPLFALGALLGGMANWEGGGAGRVAVPAVLGVGLGFLLTGGVLLPNLAPYTLYLFGLTLLSGAALLHGGVLDLQNMVEVRESVWTPRGLVRVEDRGVPDSDSFSRVVLEGPRLRGRERQDGGMGRDWENAVLAALRGEDQAPASVLYLGGGSGTLCRFLLEAFPELPIRVVEVEEAIVSLARKHLYPFEDWGKVQLQYGDPWAALAGFNDPYALLLCDLAALPSFGGLPALGPEHWRALARCSGAEGTVVLGGLPHPDKMGELPLTHLLNEVRGSFHRASLYEGEMESFILLSASEAPFWSPVLPGFHATTQMEG